MSGGYVANPMSRKNIREIAGIIRDASGLSEERYFPVVEFLELVLPQIDEQFTLEIEPIYKMGNQYGLTIPMEHRIILREDVYENAVNGIHRDRFTVAHEIGHYFLHQPDRVAFARESKKGDIPAYLDPEWQANTFAGELLAPPHLIRGLSIPEIMQYCGVSFTVGKIQLESIW